MHKWGPARFEFTKQHLEDVAAIYDGAPNTQKKIRDIIPVIERAHHIAAQRNGEMRARIDRARATRQAPRPKLPKTF